MLVMVFGMLTEILKMLVGVWKVMLKNILGYLKYKIINTLSLILSINIVGCHLRHLTEHFEYTFMKW